MSSQARRQQIPGTLVLNWQSPSKQPSKPLIRRPMTACGACRSAKVKCNGKLICERCKSRGLLCSYGPALNTNNETCHRPNGGKSSVGDRPASSESTHDSHARPTSSVSTSQTQPDPMSVDLTSSLFNASNPNPDVLPFPQTNSGLEQWGEETFNQALEEFDWAFPGSDLGLTFKQVPDINTNNLDFLQSTSEGTSSLTTTERNTSSEQATADSSAALPQRLRPSYNCHCRANMMMHIPGLEATIQELPKPQLDKMFKVTGDVIKSCQQSTSCGCDIGPVDLVCIMTVFEQTAFCFDCIAKSGFNGTVNVGIGNYSVSLTDDASLKRMLVLDLVNRANEFLDSINALAQKMFVAQNELRTKYMGRSPACLNQLNLNYVQEATASFKKLFRLMTIFFGERDSRSDLPWS